MQREHWRRLQICSDDIDYVDGSASLMSLRAPCRSVALRLLRQRQRPRNQCVMAFEGENTSDSDDHKKKARLEEMNVKFAKMFQARDSSCRVDSQSIHCDHVDRGAA